MNRSKNPYPEFLIDEASGIEVPDIRHKIWAEGYEDGNKDRQDKRRKGQNGRKE